MLVVKKFYRDDRTELVSDVFDSLICSSEFHLPFDKIELTIRDTNIALVDNYNAVVCVDYNNPLVMEKDYRGVKILLMHELFRLMFKMNLPKIIEDVIIGRELIKRGFGDELFYMYYNCVMKTSPTEDNYIKIRLPWAIFHNYDKYNSEFFRELASKMCKTRPDARRFLDILCNLSEKNIKEAVKECKKIGGHYAID